MIHFAHDEHTIFYPTGPGRVHHISLSALADCNGSDEDYADSTSVGDLEDMLTTTSGDDSPGRERVQVARTLAPHVPGSDGSVPAGWRACGFDDDLDDALEAWADWCDRDSARLDSLDEVRGAIAARAA